MNHETEPSEVMMEFEKVTIGNATLYLGDCLAVLPSLPKACAIVSDPPYGMDWDTDSTRFSGGACKRGAGRNDWGAIAEDDLPFDPTPWLAFDSVILWGANHFAQRVPVGSTLIWLKKADHLFGTFLSDAEIAWQKGGYGVYAFRKQFPPPSRAAEFDGRGPAHPTQKPIALMEWCLSRVPAELPCVDPYMGSGTTGVAAARMGRAFVGVERERKHFDTACERIACAQAQAPMFVDPSAEVVPTQADLC